MATYQVFHADCFNWLAGCADSTLEAVCTDPPYGLIEFTAQELAKLRRGKGGIWRLPPTIGGSIRAPLPRFTVLSAGDKIKLQEFAFVLGVSLYPKLCPGAHVVMAGNPSLQYLVQAGMAEAGYEVRGNFIRLYRGFRGGDRPKLAEKEYPDVCVTPRGNYEPWMLFRKPISEKTVAENLRRWKTGGLRRITESQPMPDVIESSKTPLKETNISSHPTMKPQHFLRIIVRSLLPLGEGTILDPFAGSGSTIAAAMAVGYNSIGIEIDEEYYSSIDRNICKLIKLYPDMDGTALHHNYKIEDSHPVETRESLLTYGLRHQNVPRIGMA